MDTSTRRLVRVDNVELSVCWHRHCIAREHAAPSRAEVLPSDPVEVASVRGTSPQQAGELAVETTVVLAVRLAATLYKTWLHVQARPGQAEAVARLRSTTSPSH